MPASCARGFHAIGGTAEPGLHPQNGGQVMGLLGRIHGHHARAFGHGPAHGRATVRQDVPTGSFNDAGEAVLVTQGLGAARRENPQLAIGVDLSALDQLCQLPQLLHAVVRATQHHVVHFRVFHRLV